MQVSSRDADIPNRNREIYHRLPASDTKFPTNHLVRVLKLHIWHFAFHSYTTTADVNRGREREQPPYRWISLGRFGLLLAIAGCQPTLNMHCLCVNLGNHINYVLHPISLQSSVFSGLLLLTALKAKLGGWWPMTYQPVQQELKVPIENQKNDCTGWRSWHITPRTIRFVPLSSPRPS